MSEYPLLQDSAVRDLAWVISNPPIIQHIIEDRQWTDSSFWNTQSKDSQAILQKTDANPSALHQLLNQQNDHRLGHRFETLLTYFFNSNDRYQLVAQNVRVQEAQRTLGEFDFIVNDQLLEQTQHWEVACKFYLGLEDTRDINNWHGPMLKDRLADKFNRMQTKQSRLSDHPAAKLCLQELGIHIDQHYCLMKGRLFYPITQTTRRQPALTTSDHQQGWWARPEEFIQQFKQPSYRWVILSKQQWFAAQHLDPNLIRHHASEILELFSSDPSRRPICIAGFDINNESNTEITRGFIVAGDWANELTTDNKT